MFPFYIPPVNLWFFDVFRVYKMGTLARNGLCLIVPYSHEHCLKVQPCDEQKQQHLWKRINKPIDKTDSWPLFKRAKQKLLFRHTKYIKEQGLFLS